MLNRKEKKEIDNTMEEKREEKDHLLRQEWDMGNVKRRVALITGITGQDGSYLCDYLLSLNKYEIIGITRQETSVAWTCEQLKGIVAMNTTQVHHVILEKADITCMEDMK